MGVVKTYEAEQLGEPHAFHGEGAMWDGTCLRIVDMFAGDVLVLAADGGLESRTHVGTIAAAMRPRAGGGLVVAVERGFALLDGDGVSSTLPEVWSDPAVRMNDGGTDPYGGFLCGSMAYSQEPGRGRLFRLDPSGEVRQVLEGLAISNGLGWSPDGSRVYLDDTPTRQVSMFDDDGPGRLANRRVLADVSHLSGYPDGLTVDADGGVWVAFYGGHAVRRFTPDGELDVEVVLPVSRVTSCTFGGPGLDELFITTSRENLPDDAEPQAGAVFRVDPGVRGLPALPFAG